MSDDSQMFALGMFLYIILAAFYFGFIHPYKVKNCLFYYMSLLYSKLDRGCWEYKNVEQELEK